MRKIFVLSSLWKYINYRDFFHQILFQSNISIGKHRLNYLLPVVIDSFCQAKYLYLILFYQLYLIIKLMKMIELKDKKQGIPNKQNNRNLRIRLDHNISNFIKIKPKQLKLKMSQTFRSCDYLQRVQMTNLYAELAQSQNRPNYILLNTNILFLQHYQNIQIGKYSEHQIPSKKQIENKKLLVLTDKEQEFYQLLQKLDCNLQSLKSLAQANKQRQTSAIEIKNSIGEYFLYICDVLDKDPYYFHKIQLAILELILVQQYNNQAELAELRLKQQSSIGIRQSDSSQEKKNRKINRNRSSRQQRNPSSVSSGSNSNYSHNTSAQGFLNSIYNFILCFQLSSCLEDEYCVVKKIEYRYQSIGLKDQIITQYLTNLNIKRLIQNVKYVNNLQGLNYMLKYYYQHQQLSNIPIKIQRKQQQFKLYFKFYCQKGATQFHKFLEQQNQTKLMKIQVYNFIMSYFYGILELEKHKIIHEDLEICNFVQFEEIHKIIDYKKIICLNGGPNIKNIYRQIFKLILQSQNIQKFLLDQMKKDQAKYLGIYNNYKQQKKDISATSNLKSFNNPQSNDENQLLQKAINKFLQVFEGNMELKHYSQFRRIIVDTILAKGKRKTGFALSQNEIQCIISLFPSIEEVSKNIKVLQAFKQSFIPSLQQIQKKCRDQQRIDRNQLRFQSQKKRIYNEHQHEKKHAQNLQAKNELIKELLGEQFLHKYCCLQKLQPNQAFRSRYHTAKYIELSKSPQLTYKYIVSVVDIMCELQKKGMVQLHVDENTYTFDGEILKLASLSYIYKIKMTLQQKTKDQQKVTTAITKSYLTFRYAVLLLNAENRLPFFILAQKIQKQIDFNQETFQRIATQNLSYLHAESIFISFNYIYCLAVNSNINQTTSSIQQDKDEKYKKFETMKAAVYNRTKSNPNDYVYIKQAVQKLNIFKTQNFS